MYKYRYIVKVCTIQVQITAKATLDEIYFRACSSNLYEVLICMYNSIHDRSRVGHMEREYVKPIIPMLL